MFDIDNFKYVAETLGTEAGDELLVILAKLIRGRLRQTDLLARLGGDEFGILLHGAGRAKATTVAEELLELVREHPFAVAKQSVRVTLSVGISTSVEERPITGAELLTEAEMAMYSAKEAGRDRVSEYTAEGKEDVEAKRMWSERVRQATEKGLFVLVCQPIASSPAGRISQHELLLRMRGEDGEPGPARCLPRDRRAVRADPGRRSLGHPAGDPADRRPPRRGSRAASSRSTSPGTTMTDDELRRPGRAGAERDQDRPRPAHLRDHRDRRRRRHRSRPADGAAT